MANTAGYSIRQRNASLSYMSRENKTVPLDTTIIYLFGSYVIVAAIIGTFGNLLVVIAFIKFKRLHNNCNALLVNLAISDELMGLAGMPMTAVAFFMKKWPFGEIGCQIYGFLCFFFGAASMTTVCLLSIERYYRLTRVQKFKAKHCVIQITFIWCYALFWALCPLIGWSRYQFEPYKLSCTLDWHNPTPETFSFVFCACLFVFFIPVAVMVTCYAKIVSLTRTNRQKLARFGRWTNSDDGKREQQLTVMTAIIVVCFLVIWSPYAILSFMAAFDAFNYTSAEASLVAPVLAKSGIFINPIIYSCTHYNFRRAFKEILCGKRETFV